MDKRSTPAVGGGIALAGHGADTLRDGLHDGEALIQRLLRDGGKQSRKIFP